MKLVASLILFSSLVSCVVITSPAPDSSIQLPHLTATFGPSASTYSVSGVLVSDRTLLCSDTSDLSQLYLNQIVLVERGVCTFTDKALHAQALGAIGVIIGGNDDSDTLAYLGGAAGYEHVIIPTVYISGQSYQKLVRRIAQSDYTVSATLNNIGEADGTIGFLTPLPTTSTGASSTDPSDPATSGPYVPPDISDPTDDFDYETPDVTSTIGIVWIIVGLSVLVKCIIITVACRRRYRSRSRLPSQHTASSADAALLTEGEVSDATPAVYATYPTPSSAFTVSTADQEGSLPSSSSSATRSISASSLSMYPSIQYASLMPQATAPSDVYAYDLEKQAVVIRG